MCHQRLQSARPCARARSCCLKQSKVYMQCLTESITALAVIALMHEHVVSWLKISLCGT